MTAQCPTCGWRYTIAERVLDGIRGHIDISEGHEERECGECWRKRQEKEKQ